MGAEICKVAGAIVAQGPVVYQPMAQELARVYLANPDGSTAKIALSGTFSTAALDIASEFGTEFMRQIAHEIVMEAGLGVIGSLCIPVLGGIVGAALDYLIANTMTWRVGTMVSMYFQNGSVWLKSREDSYQEAKRLTGGIGSSVAEVTPCGENRKDCKGRSK